ncbi:MAG TPA: Hsp20/alpha crystallin family protein [Candidatus Aminicenantes bacterium]|nr:Hsp20/alpha crystallin family protein [Candidatus Aminicenantes bacterium]
MIRKIKPVSKIIRIETEIRRYLGGIHAQNRELSGLEQIWIPVLDIYEKEEEVVVEVELPGILKKDVEIIICGTRIEVKGMKKEEAGGAGLRYHRLEREYGAFRRVAFVPSSVDPDRTTAVLANGILTIVLKKQERKSREIEVKIGKTES